MSTIDSQLTEIRIYWLTILCAILIATGCGMPDRQCTLTGTMEAIQ